MLVKTQIMIAFFSFNSLALVKILVEDSESATLRDLESICCKMALCRHSLQGPPSLVLKELLLFI